MAQGIARQQRRQQMGIKIVVIADTAHDNVGGHDDTRRSIAVTASSSTCV